ncbi:predicted protein [Phaeodactylum tricornutum CCAP 1055/1]|jgi:hypothetical protein|uniref:Uncharacterized protein n=1 Tax=Phaeodactylum tricornutum (strain CCAP 1055/1) TaxID=556484 RepID=B7GCR7_PHATC|nr:predicted protein [Phaeodactylum tricornutum CCAP 1055/1]EEC43665.1 predicted protein [Phaeodactylum tricornutum CCAP 1055/1]|eukprot:XP_002184929.1 predicted protein [Phaeodactylum tricornutum CCAP 1055/1]
MRFLVLLGLFATASAWTTSSAVSSFGGSVLVTGRGLTTATPSLTMKKGKDNLPPQMRSQYKKQKEMMAMREEMIAAQKPGQDGLPVFNLFVRTKKANMWYPCGSFKGDERSAALAKSYADGGLLAGVSKRQIDGGIAGSLYRDQGKLKESVARSYPQLRKSREDFEFGYKLSYDGLSEEQSSEIKVIEPKETKGVFDSIKNAFSGN